MKTEKEKITCLLDVAGKGSVKTFVKVSVKGLTDRSPVHKPVIKGGKGKRSSLLDGGIVHVKRNYSWGMEN